MNTTEIAVEQVIAGTLALMVAGLPFVVPEILLCLETTWFGILILGITYVLGTVADKAADTVLGSLEQLVRLRVAVKATNPIDKTTKLIADPFPQDGIEANLL